jgi:L-threonylcarbamoyladenylate synthase
MDGDAIRAAARLLEAGKLVGMPTETVYGLAADAGNPDAVAAIFAAKGRPSNHPVIVHVARDADLSHWAAEVPSEAHQLINAFWPGPLTLILQCAADVPAAVTGGQASVGLRCPSHPVAQALLKEFRQGQGGLAAPSANRFGRVSPTTAQHVIDEFGAPGTGPLAAVLDGGQSEVGIESTIVDVTRLDTLGPVLLRPGRIGAVQIGEVLGLQLALPDLAAPRVSGSLDAHYAPATPVALVASSDLTRITASLQAQGKRVVMLPCAGDAHAYAHALYAALRALDRERADLILVEQPPQDAAWQGVNDRLRRAAFDSAGIVQRLLA